MMLRYLVANAVLLLPSVAGASVVVTNSTQFDAPYAVASGDLFETSATVTSAGTFSREGEVGLSSLTDGSFGQVGSMINCGCTLQAATADNSNSVTFTFNSLVNLTSISSFAGWDAYRGGQSYTVSYATGAAPTTFITLASVFNDAKEGGNTATRAVITDNAGLLAYHAKAVRFTFNGDLTYGYAGYRELDAIGNAVPEPAAWSLMIVGFGLAGGALRRQKRAKRVGAILT